MTKTIDSSMLQIHTVVVSTFLPVPAYEKFDLILCASLEKDPFIEHALSAVSCEFYDKYGLFLVPLTTTLIMAKYCQFKHTCPVTNNGGGNTTSEGRNTDCTTSNCTTDGKMLVDTVYHLAVVSSLAIGYACIAKMITKATPPKLDFNGYDIGMMVPDVGLAMATKDMLIKQGLIQEDIIK